MCALYYYLWAILLPQWRNYSLRQEFVTLEGGAQTLQLRKVPNSELAAWDASHDAAGHLIGRDLSDSDNEKENECYDTKRHVRLREFIIGVWEERANAMPVETSRESIAKRRILGY